MRITKTTLLILLAVTGIWLFSSGCSPRYYNRYPKEQKCKMQDKGAKKARKIK